MDNKEILKRSIEKAIKNGYKLPYEKVNGDYISGDYVRFYIEYNLDIAIETTGSIKWESHPYQVIIFSHEFAKAYWGKDETTISNDFSDGGETKDQFMKRFRPKDGIAKRREYEWRDFVTEPAWQFHIQQLALAEDRIGYLAKFL